MSKPIRVASVIAVALFPGIRPAWMLFHDSRLLEDCFSLLFVAVLFVLPFGTIFQVARARRPGSKKGAIDAALAASLSFSFSTCIDGL